MQDTWHCNVDVTAAYLMSLQSSKSFVAFSLSFSTIISGKLHASLANSWSRLGTMQLLVFNWNLRPCN